MKKTAVSAPGQVPDGFGRLIAAQMQIGRPIKIRKRYAFQKDGSDSLPISDLRGELSKKLEKERYNTISSAQPYEMREEGDVIAVYVLHGFANKRRVAEAMKTFGYSEML